jgi:CheY-like chemotaxis protein
VNLVLNAVDALPAGGTIVLTAATRASETVVEVRDDGVGMPPDVQARLFEPFFTTKGTRGTGLGLTMVRTAIERHDGKVEVESVQGRGTTFRLRLPVAPSGQRSDGPASGPTSAGSRRLRVLVVEDEPQLVAASATLLTAQGHSPTVVHNGDEAISALAVATFDAVVCGLGLGTGLSGWDVARAVRERAPSTRFVLATGWAAAVDPQMAQAAGVHALLDKPYDQTALARALAPG